MEKKKGGRFGKGGRRGLETRPILLTAPGSSSINFGTFSKMQVALTFAALALLPLVHSKLIDDTFNVPKAVVIWLAGSLILLLLALQGLRAGHLILPKSKLFFLPFIYVAALAAATPFSILPEISVIGAHGLTLGLLAYVASLGLFIGGWRLAAQQSQLKAFARLIAAVAFILSGLAWLEYFGLDYPVAYSKFSQGAVGALIGNPTNFGAFLCLLFPVLIGYFVLAEGREKTLAGFSIVFTLTGVGLSRSTAAIIVTVLVGTMLIFLFIKDRLGFRFRLLVPLTGALTAGLVLLALFPSDRSNVAYRFTQWQAAARIIAAKPLTGTGLGTGRYVLSRYATPTHRLQEEFIGDAHNLVLNNAASTGVISSVILMVFIGGLVAKGLVSGEKDRLKLCLAAAILSFFLVEQTTPEFPAIVGYFWIFAGILTAKITAAETFKLRARFPFYSTAILALATVVAASTLSLRLLTAEYRHQKTMASKTAAEAIESTYQATQALPYYDFYYGNLATMAIRMSKEVSKEYLPIVEFAAKKAIKINRFESKNYESLGFYYLLLDKKPETYRKAAGNFQHSLETNPYNPEALFGLSKTYFLLGRRAEGRRYRDKFAKYFDQTDQRFLELRRLDR